MALALAANDDAALATIIDNGVSAPLKASGVISQVERVELGRDWVRRFARARLPQMYREKDAQKVAEFTWFLKAS